MLTNSNYLLRFTVFLFPITVYYAHINEDHLYHTICLLLTCSSLVRYWCAYVTPTISWVDRIVAHLCYAMCAHTHLVEFPNLSGGMCLLAVLTLWVYEHYVYDWALWHALLHLNAFIGIILAIQAAH